MIQKDGHVHKYVIPKQQKVSLTAGKKTAIDVLKQHACECGAVITQDLERKILG